jgi:hypothetical protein
MHNNYNQIMINLSIIKNLDKFKPLTSLRYIIKEHAEPSTPYEA